MKRRIMLIGAVLILLVIAYFTGQSDGSDREVKQRIERDLELHGKLVELDRQFLASVATRPNALVSGKYALETRIAGGTTTVSLVEIELSEGRLRKLTGECIQDMAQTGNVVSWEQGTMDETPFARFIGLIDGDGMWGRVYVKPGTGWHEGDPPKYGVWRLRRQPEANEEPTTGRTVPPEARASGKGKGVAI